jgi:hypothetical protein
MKKITFQKNDQINGFMGFSNSPLKIMKFDTIDFKNGVELRENNWKKILKWFFSIGGIGRQRGRERKRVGGEIGDFALSGRHPPGIEFYFRSRKLGPKKKTQSRLYNTKKSGYFY